LLKQGHIEKEITAGNVTMAGIQNKELLNVRNAEESHIFHLHL
jgi:hypothetical protein